MEMQMSKRAKVDIKKRSQRPLSENKMQFNTSHPCLPPVAGITTHLTITDPSASAIFLPHTAVPASINDEEMEQFNQLTLSNCEIIASLRVLKQPATLCGEDDGMRLQRLKTLLKAGALKMTMMELITQGKYLYPLSVGGMENYERFRLPQCGSRSSKQERSKADCDAYTNDLDGMDIASILALDTDAEHARMKLTFDTLCEEYKIMVFFKQLLREWEIELKNRPESEKSTSKGHFNVAIYNQSVHTMAPLLKMCKERTLPADLKQPMVIIVEHCLQRDYLSAIDEYTKLIFDKVPPPEEYSMVEIQEHARINNASMHGVEMLVSADDETSKYLQCVRRLMTLCQRLYPWRPLSLIDVNGAKGGTITALEAVMFAEECLKIWKDGKI